MRYQKYNKYGNKRVTWNGRKFDSKAECNWAKKFEAMKKTGHIKEIEYQPRFELIPKPNKITYVADFRIIWANGEEEIIDIKGMETQVFKLKKKMFKHRYPHLKLTLLK